MQYKLLLIIAIILLCILMSCAKNSLVTEDKLIGVWKELNLNHGQSKVSKGVRISKKDFRLFKEEIVFQSNQETDFSLDSSGCFIHLKQDSRDEQNLNYTCEVNSFQLPIKMHASTLLIGNRVFKRYRR